MSNKFLTRTFSKNSSLLRAMLAFNGLTALPPLPASLLALEAHTDIALLWEKAAVRRRFGVTCPPTPDYWDFEKQSCRLALLDAATLHRLCLTFGIAAIAQDICCLLRRDDVLKARQQLGQAHYDYALHRARFQVDPAMLPPKILRQDRHSSLDKRALAVGAHSLLTLTADWPQVLRKHIPITVPATASSTRHPKVHLFDDQGREQLWAAVKKVLLMEVAPSWAPCFA